MSKRSANVEVPETGNTEVSETPVSETPASAAPAANFTLVYRRAHPQARWTYGVDGNSGVVVIPASLLKGSDAPGFEPPATIMVDVELVAPKATAKVDKAEAAAAKLAERAAKAAAKVAAAQAKVQERQAKAEAALAAAKAKVEAALAKAAS